jgi:hypothetical protein
MDEELIDYFFGIAQKEGFKKTREDFVKYVQTDDELFDYLYGKAQKEGYKKDKNHFSGLVGRGANQPVQEPAKTEVVTTEPAKTETVTEESPMAAKEPISMPTKFSAREVSETVEPSKVDLTNKEKSDRLSDVTEAKKKAMAEDMSSKLMPVTEKTQVKEVVKEEPKLKVKSKKKKDYIPIDIDTIELKPGEFKIQADKVPGIETKPSKIYKPYGENGPDVYYSEESNQYIIKQGDERVLVGKESERYNEIQNKISELVGKTKEGQGKCDPATGGSCSPTNEAISDFLSYSKDDYIGGARTSFEGNLSQILDDRKKRYEKYGQSIWSKWDESDNIKDRTDGSIHYANEKLPKGDRFIIYKPYGDDKTLIYDKNSEIILKQLDQKAPMVDLSVTGQVVDEKGNVVKKGSAPREYWQKYAKENPNEGLTVWQGYELDHPEYKELKSLIDGVNYKKEKGTKNTFVPISPNFDPMATPDWMKNK